MADVDRLYVLDTSVLIQSWNDYYRPNAFPSFWSRIDEALSDSILISPENVRDEIEQKDDALYEWAKNHPQLFIDADAKIQIVQEEIINRFPNLIDTSKNRSMADPWVIALAQIRECPVVTTETRSSKRPKIPNVCDELGLGCISIFELIESLNWTF